MKIRKYTILKIICVCFTLLLFYLNRELNLDSNQKRQQTLTPGNFISKFKYNVTNQNQVIGKKGANKFLTCPNKIKRPEQKLRNTWQPMDFFNEDVYIYSAFIEISVVRIIGAVDPALRSNLQVFCYLWSKVDNRLVITDATLIFLSKEYDGRFLTTVFRCSLDLSKPEPDSVSLVRIQCERPSNILKITKQEYTQRQFTVCLSPLYSSYTNAYRLIEWIELNRLLGAEQFIIYTCEASHDVAKVLRYYLNLGIVNVMQWCIPTSRLPDESSRQFKVFGKIASNNDCLFRLRESSKFIVLEDPDEIIVPQNYMTWNELFNSLPVARGDYNFRDVKFCEEWPGNVLSVEKPKLSYILKTQRETNIYLFTEKPESIIDPNFVDLLTDHKVAKYRGNGGPYHVPPGIAFAHQYIHCGAYHAQSYSTKDLTLLKYKGELVNAAFKVIDEIGNI